MEEENKDYRLPLGLCKQAVMKLDSFMTDIREIMVDPDLSDDEYHTFNYMCEMAAGMTAAIVNIIRDEISEEEFTDMHVEMDQIDSYPDGRDMPLDEIDEDMEEQIRNTDLMQMKVEEI